MNVDTHDYFMSPKPDGQLFRGTLLLKTRSKKVLRSRKHQYVGGGGGAGLEIKFEQRLGEEREAVLHAFPTTILGPP